LLCPSRLHLSSFIFTLKQEKLASHMVFTRREKLTSVEELTPSLLIKEGITLLSLSKSQPQVHCKYDCLSNHFLFFFFLLVTLQHLNLFIYLFVEYWVQPSFFSSIYLWMEWFNIDCYPNCNHALHVSFTWNQIEQHILSTWWWW